MIFMTKTYLVTLLSFCCSAALAGTGQGTVAKVENGPLYGAKVFLTIDGTVSDQPACRSAGNYHFVFDTTVPGGKELLATVLLAKANRQGVIVSGYNQCSLYNGVEDLRWFRLK